MRLRVSALITEIVSWPLLATNTRLPFGEITMFQGSAPVLIVFSTTAAKPPTLGLLILITVTLLAAALATNANLLLGARATLCGSLPTLIVLRRELVSVRTTETLLSSGFTLHTSRLSADSAIGLE